MDFRTDYIKNYLIKMNIKIEELKMKLVLDTVEELENTCNQLKKLKPLKINLHDYAYNCGDGCCFNYGIITTVNGVELPCQNQDVKTILTQVLEHLGYNAEITTTDDTE